MPLLLTLLEFGFGDALSGDLVELESRCCCVLFRGVALGGEVADLFGHVLDSVLDRICGILNLIRHCVIELCSQWSIYKSMIA